MDKEQRLVDLERRVSELEEEIRRNLPLPKPFTPMPIEPLPDDSTDPQCGVCGGRFRDMTHYVCHHPQCPGRIICGGGQRW